MPQQAGCNSRAVIPQSDCMRWGRPKQHAAPTHAFHNSKEVPDHVPELSERRAATFSTVRARLMRRSRDEHRLADEPPSPPPPPPPAKVPALHSALPPVIFSSKHCHWASLKAKITKSPPKSANSGSLANRGCEKRKRMASSSISNVSHCCFFRLDEVFPSSARAGRIQSEMSPANQEGHTVHTLKPRSQK